MFSPSRNSNESDMTTFKNLLEKVAQDVQALSFRQLHHEVPLISLTYNYSYIRLTMDQGSTTLD